MRSELDPVRLLAREEERARREIARARERLAQRALGATDPLALMKRHPLIALAGTGVACFFGTGPLRSALRRGKSVAGLAGRGLGFVLSTLVRRALLTI